VSVLSAALNVSLMMAWIARYSATSSENSRGGGHGVGKCRSRRVRERYSAHQRLYGLVVGLGNTARYEALSQLYGLCGLKGALSGESFGHTERQRDADAVIDAKRRQDFDGLLRKLLERGPNHHCLAQSERVVGLDGALYSDRFPKSPLLPTPPTRWC
jgi:hypothetical protein